jgi:hypothetical protein
MGGQVQTAEKVVKHSVHFPMKGEEGFPLHVAGAIHFLRHTVGNRFLNHSGFLLSLYCFITFRFL